MYLLFILGGVVVIVAIVVVVVVVAVFVVVIVVVVVIVFVVIFVSFSYFRLKCRTHLFQALPTFKDKLVFFNF